MTDGKMRLIILSLCIGGAVLAGISSRTDSHDSGGRLEFRKLWTDLRALITGEPSGPAGANSSPVPPPAATGTEGLAPGGPSEGQRPEHSEDGRSAEHFRPGTRIQTAEEVEIGKFIDTTFRQYYRSYQIAGRSRTIRMPFGLNNEREGSRGYSQIFYLGGKGTPEQLWPYIDSVLASERFAEFVDAITSPGDKVILFELERQTYSLSRDEELIRSLQRGFYPGTPTRIFVLKNSLELAEADVYNYLYAVASVGVDCSGFTFHIHDSIARAYGTDLRRLLADRWRTDPDLVARRVGLWFYDPANGYTEKFDDRIENLRPADIILYRGSDGGLKHSAVIQSIDLQKGLIRYVQCTDWALKPERGVHQSVILFDPARPQVSLKHHSVIWKQQVRPPFNGEPEPRDWLTDRDRYAWYPAAGGSLVVRLQYLKAVFEEREPLYYANAAGE